MINFTNINVEGSGYSVPIIINDEQTINPQQDSVYIIDFTNASSHPHLILGTDNVPIGCKITVLPSSNAVASSGFVTYKNIAKIDNTVFLITGGSATFVFTNEGTWDVLSGASFYMDFATYYGLSSSMKQKEPSNWKHITGSGTYYFRYGDQPDSAYMLPKDSETTITVVNGGALYNYSSSSSELLHIPGMVVATAYTDINTTSGNQKHPTMYTIGGKGNRTGSEGSYVPEITWNTSWELMHKVGQMHQIPLSSSVSTGYTLQYIVTNGMCSIEAYLDRIIPLSSLTVVATGLPKPKFSTVTQSYTNATSPTNPILMRIRGSSDGNGEMLIAQGSSSNCSVYFNISYPVADDWVES